MGDHETPGSKLSARLMARDTGLHRQSMEDGGEVYAGPIAKRALRAMGARAMTMDNTIFVADDFDPSNPEDQALYAHERLHQMESGGENETGAVRDAEEIAARAVERMVLHRAESGESLGSIMRDVRDGAADAPAVGPAAQKREDGPTEDEATQAYSAMIASGMTHEQIVRQLTDYVVKSMMSSTEDTSFRSSPTNSI